MADPPLAARGSRVFVALHHHLPLLGEDLSYVTLKYRDSDGRHFAAGGVKLMVEPYDLSVVFSLALHSHDVFITITEGPIDDVANVLCEVDAYSAMEARLGTGATFAPNNDRLLAAGYEGVAVVNIGFWKPFADVLPELMLADADCLHLRGCFFVTKKERAIRLARDFDAMWDHFVESGNDPYAWPASPET